MNIKCRVLRDHRNGGNYYFKGQIIEPPAMLRSVLLTRKIIEVIDDSPQIKRRDPEGSETATMTRPTRTKRKAGGK